MLCDAENLSEWLFLNEKPQELLLAAPHLQGKCSIRRAPLVVGRTRDIGSIIAVHILALVAFDGDAE